MQSNAVFVPKLGNLDLLQASQVGQEWGLNILLYGQSGVGKTTLAASAQDSPYGRNVLYLDLEGGTFSISDHPDISIYRPKDFNDISKAYRALDQETHTFKTVVIDSLTEAQRLAQESIVGVGNSATITQQQWGQTNEKLIAMVRAFRSLTHKKGIHTIFTALDRQIGKEDELVVTKPALTPGSATTICASMDSVGYMKFDEKSDKRTLHLVGTNRFIAKVRQPVSQKTLPDKFVNPSMVAILAALRGEGGQAHDVDVNPVLTKVAV